MRDATGKARFCISFSLPLNQHVNQQEHLLRISRLLRRIPRTMGGEGDGLQENDVPASTILTRLQKLLWVEPAKAQPKASPLFSHDPPVERMRYLTELTRLHWSTLPPYQMAEMLMHHAITDSIIAFVHARSAEAAHSLRQFIDRLLQQKEGSDKASEASDMNIDSWAADVTLNQEEQVYLDEVRRAYVEPFVMTEERLGEMVSVTASAAFALDEDATWVGMLGQTTQHLPYAFIAADMHEPGAKLVTVNAAFEQLTGWSSADAIGKNCRFLQGFQTEQKAVKQMVEAVRTAQPIQLELTNYRADSSTFRNLLSLQPVFDADGVYRYCIGVLADASAMSASEREGLERLRQHLPRRCAALAKGHKVQMGYALVTHSPIKVRQPSRSKLDEMAALRFAKLRMFCDPDASLTSALEDPHHLGLFRKHLSTAAPAKALESVDFYVEAQRFLAFNSSEQREKVHSMFSHYGTEFEDKAAEMGEYASKQVALSNVKLRRDASFADLANHMPSFICSPKSDAMVSHRVESAPAATHLMWEKYKVAPDAAPWLYAMVDVVDKLPIPISISDMRLAGNPLVSTRPSASAPASLRQR